MSEASDAPTMYSIAMKSTPCVLADVIDRDDVRMVQGGSGSRFLDETLSALAVDRSFIPEQLDRDGPSETGVNGAIDDPHAALTDR